MRALALLVVAASVSAPSFARPAAAAPAAGYRLVARWTPGGEGGWDYLTVDPERHRLFVARGSHVQVLDLETGGLLGDLPDTPGVHGVALAPDLGRGFTSNGRDSSVTVFDLGTLAAVGRIPLDARNPDAILYEPVTRRVITFNGGSHDATAIDAATGSVVGRIALGDKPEFAVADGRGHVFVNLEDGSAVAELDARTLTLEHRWPIAPGEHPTGLAIDLEHRRLFSVCGNGRMIVLDPDRGRIVADLPIGRGVDGVAFDPARGLAVSSNGEGTLTVVREQSPDRFVRVADVPTRRGARTIALDPGTHRLYTVTASFGAAPAATPENPHPRPPIVPGSFTVLVLEPR